MKNHNLKIIVSITACLVFFLFFSSETGMAKERIDGEISYNGVNFDLGIQYCLQSDIDFSPEGWKDTKCFFWLRADQDLPDSTTSDILTSIFNDYDGYSDDSLYLQPYDPESETWLFVTTDADVNYPVRIDSFYKSIGDFQQGNLENLGFSVYKGIPFPTYKSNFNRPIVFYFAIPEAMNYQSLVFSGINLQINIPQYSPGQHNEPEIHREILDGFPDSFTVDDYQIDLSDDFILFEGKTKIQSMIKVKNLNKTKQRSFIFDDYFQLYSLEGNFDFLTEKPYIRDPKLNSLAPFQEKEIGIVWDTDWFRYIYEDSPYIEEINENYPLHLPKELYIIPKFDSNLLYKIQITGVAE